MISISKTGSCTPLSRFSPSPAAPGMVPTFAYGSAFIDGPNVMTSLVPLVGRICLGPNKLDLKRIRSELKAGHGIRHFEFVMGKHPSRPRSVLRDVVRSQHWKYVEVCRPRYGRDAKDPVDDHIREMILRKLDFRCPSGSTLALLSHDGGFAPVLERALDEGWKLLILGLVKQMSHRLRSLASNHVEVVDLSALGLSLKEPTSVDLAPRFHGIPRRDPIAEILSVL